MDTNKTNNLAYHIRRWHKGLLYKKQSILGKWHPPWCWLVHVILRSVLTEIHKYIISFCQVKNAKWMTFTVYSFKFLHFSCRCCPKAHCEPSTIIRRVYYLMALRINYLFILNAQADLSIGITRDLVIAAGTATHKNGGLSTKLTLLTRWHFPEAAMVVSYTFCVFLHFFTFLRH